MRKKQIICLLCCITMFSGMAYGCGKNGNADTPQNSIVEDAPLPEGTFDIEAVRKNISIKGHHFEIPQKLSDLDNELKYEFEGDDFEDGLREVTISDKNGVVLETIVDNAKKKSGSAILFNITLTDSDSKIAGIVPTVTTVDEMTKMLGEPDEITEADAYKFYYYGQNSSEKGYRKKGKHIVVKVNISGIAESVSIRYVE